MVKANKAASLLRRKQINANPKNQPRKSPDIDSRKVHDTKGKNNHGRSF